MMLRRILFSMGLFVLLSGCFYAKQEALDALPAQPHCPFQERVTYEGFEPGADENGNPIETRIGKFRFVEDADTGKCVLTDAAGLSAAGSQAVYQALGSETRHVDGGVHVSYDRGGSDPATGYTGMNFVILYDDGTIDIRASCLAADGAEKLVLPGVPLDGEGKSCHLDTVPAIKAAAKNFRMISVSRSFRPAAL